MLDNTLDDHGQPRNRAYNTMRFLAPLLATLFLITSPALAGPTCVTQSGWHFARTEEDLDRALRYVHQGDKAAFTALINQRRLLPLKGGVQVYLEPGGGLTTSAIRLPGMTTVVWVPNKAISCK